jgi:hypothetical protein
MVLIAAGPDVESWIRRRLQRRAGGTTAGGTTAGGTTAGGTTS